MNTQTQLVARAIERVRTNEQNCHLQRARESYFFFGTFLRKPGMPISMCCIMVVGLR